MQITEIMSKNLISLTPDDTAGQAARVLARHGIGMLPIISKTGTLRGVVTDRDIVLRAMACEDEPELVKISEIMSRTAVCVDASADVREGVRLMSHHRVRRLPVTDKNRVVGVVSLGDVCKSGECEMEAAKALSQICE